MERNLRVGPGNKRRIQVRKVRKGGFTDEKKQKFLDTLSGCATISRSAAAARVSVETINYHRRRDPVFARQCAEALDVGYDNLETNAVAEAAGGHFEPGPDAASAPGPGTVDKALALHLLRLRRMPLGQRSGRGGCCPKRVSEKELNEAILAHLDVLARRLRGKKRSPGRGPTDAA